jgi:hypothetical protein
MRFRWRCLRVRRRRHHGRYIGPGDRELDCHPLRRHSASAEILVIVFCSNMERSVPWFLTNDHSHEYDSDVRISWRRNEVIANQKWRRKNAGTQLEI